MKKYFCFLLVLIIFIMLAMSACQTKPEEAAEVTNTPTPTLPPEQEEIYIMWEGSQHADTYAMEKGPNTYCAKCHSPINWDNSAKIDDPPNCVSCKFPFEEEPRIAAGNPLVPEEDWKDIGCEICHRMDGRVAEAEFAWYDSASGYYEVVQTSTELCEKCHTNTEQGILHERELGDEVHQGYTCTDCHDPHDPYVSCGNKQCHVDVVEGQLSPLEIHLNISDKSQCLGCHPDGMNTHPMEVQRNGEKDCLVCHDYFANLIEADLPPVYHSSTHKNVECATCHNGSGLVVGPVEGEENWVLYRRLEQDFGPPMERYQSHNLTTNVDCTRCHFEDNPWNIPETIAEN